MTNGFTKDSIIAAQMNQPKELAWNIPTEFPDLTHHKQIAVDLETCDPNLTTLGPGWVRKDGFVVSIAVAAGDWEGYFPIRHANGHNMDARIALKWLQKQMATPHIDKIFQRDLRCGLATRRRHQGRGPDHRYHDYRCGG